MFETENKEECCLQGVWKRIADSSKKTLENSIVVKGREIKSIIDRIMELTSDEGVIEIYKLKDNTQKSLPFKTLRVCNDIDLCFS
ncbi:MAG: hypothetical protein JW891_15530 [Candidatus Lokiarchaeota archaeon]|nr:hypothetical protein [Candidatus Lokiarchaeota archaeon]